MKSEPNTYSIMDLKRDQQTLWDGVRNYQARNFLLEMQPGDQAFFYHSNTDPPGIVGLMQIVESGVVDPCQFDSKSSYYDPKSTREKPRWHTVTVAFKEIFPQIIALEALKQSFTDDDLWVVRRGNRLSVMPVDPSVAQKILQMVGAAAP
jgi:predicted RNA-binding protein with PUA-like domain